MKLVKVRCWKVEKFRRGAPVPDELFITYPEDNAGHDLITCCSCGQVYAITIATEVYVGPARSEKLRGVRCTTCGVSLEDNVAAYPETYIVEGEVFHSERGMTIPPDADSIVKELPGIYE